MPNATKGGKLRKSTPGNETKTKIAHKKGSDAKHSLSRGQRKRLAKKEQFLKREKMILSTLHLNRLDENKGRIDGLDAIKEALPDTMTKTNQGSDHNAVTVNNNNNNETQQKPKGTTTLKSNRAKQNLAQRELHHMNLVLQHPTFNSDPFATIQEHLKNTLAGQAKQLEEEAEKKQKEHDKKRNEAKEARKERLRDYKFAKNKKGRYMRGRK